MMILDKVTLVNNCDIGHGFDYFYGLPYTLVESFDRKPEDNFLQFEKALGTQIAFPILFLLILRK